jgi:hypothetical protein
MQASRVNRRHIAQAQNDDRRQLVQTLGHLRDFVIGAE